jgi:hypothetical protein
MPIFDGVQACLAIKDFYSEAILKNAWREEAKEKFEIKLKGFKEEYATYEEMEATESLSHKKMLKNMFEKLKY